MDGLCSSVACCLGENVKGWASNWVPSLSIRQHVPFQDEGHGVVQTGTAG